MGISSKTDGDQLSHSQTVQYSDVLVCYCGTVVPWWTWWCLVCNNCNRCVINVIINCNLLSFHFHSTPPLCDYRDANAVAVEEVSAWKVSRMMAHQIHLVASLRPRSALDARRQRVKERKSERAREEVARESVCRWQCETGT
jgi:hypothetical protein